MSIIDFPRLCGGTFFALLFYEEVFDVLARRHDANKGYERSYKTGLSKDDFVKYFSEICFRAYKDERLTFTEDEFKDYLKKLKSDVDADDFLYDISYNLCMLLQEGRTYHFVHRPFQEYFSAVFIKEQENKHLKKLGRFFENTMTVKRAIIRWPCCMT